MQKTIHLCDLWKHTITNIFKHDPESELDIKIRQWVIDNKLEDFNSLLNYTDKDFTPHGGGNLSFYDMILPVVSLFLLRSNNSMTRTSQ